MLLGILIAIITIPLKVLSLLIFSVAVAIITRSQSISEAVGEAVTVFFIYAAIIVSFLCIWPIKSAEAEFLITHPVYLLGNLTGSLVQVVIFTAIAKFIINKIRK